MATMLWSDFYEALLPELPDAPHPVVDTHLRRTAIDFCANTQVWIADALPIVGSATVGQYDLLAPVDEAVVCAALQVWFEGETLKFIPYAQMRRYNQHWPSEVGVTHAYTQMNEKTITLYPKPNLPPQLAIEARVALKPSFKAAGLPDWIGEKYFDTLVAGAKARLMGMVNVPWAEPRAAASYASIYEGQSMSTALAKRVSRSRDALSGPAGGNEQ